MKRSGTLRRGAKLMGRSRVRPVNRKRRAKANARNFSDEAEAVRVMPCLCGSWQAVNPGLLDITTRCTRWGRSVAAHVTARGMGGAKGGRFDLVPLCDAHHREAGEARTSERGAFESRYGLDLRAEADRIAALHAPPLGIRGLAKRWIVSDDLFAFEVLRLAARLGSNGMSLTSTVEGKPCPARRQAIDRLIALGLLRDDGLAILCDGDGYTIEPEQEVECWVLTRDGSTMESAGAPDAYETDALLGWVRRECEREADRRRPPDTFVAHVARALGLDESLAAQLLDAAEVHHG